MEKHHVLVVACLSTSYLLPRQTPSPPTTFERRLKDWSWFGSKQYLFGILGQSSTLYESKLAVIERRIKLCQNQLYSKKQ